MIFKELHLIVFFSSEMRLATMITIKIKNERKPQNHLVERIQDIRQPVLNHQTKIRPEKHQNANITVERMTTKTVQNEKRKEAKNMMRKSNVHIK